jgi:pyrroline-5-carboxylate reductase
MDIAPIAFIGGGHMAGALIGGLIAAGRDPSSVWVVEPAASRRDWLQATWPVRTLDRAGAELAAAGAVVWAVKPQVFADAAAPCAGHVAGALHLSVMAGIRTDALVRATGSRHVVRAMPNTPALIGQGIAGLYACPEVDAEGRRWVEQLLAPTGATLWVDREVDLDAVTALSGSGPAYVFYLLEAMMDAAQRMGLSAAQGRTLAQATVAGAAALATQSSESPATLREQVTSKGGTTHAAISSMQVAGVGPAIVQAILAAQKRARELGDEFGR